MPSRSSLLYLSRLSHQAGRFKSLLDAIVALVEMGVSLTDEERSLFTIALKENIKQSRVAFLAVRELQLKSKSTPEVDRLTLAKEYKEKLGAEILTLSDKGIKIINTYILTKEANTFMTIYYSKLLGDLYRYRAEVTLGAEHEKNVEDALNYYQNSSDMALTTLPASSPLRLSLALAFSVFYYEQLASPERACLIAKGAFDDAVVEMDKGNSDALEESSIILGLLRENLEMWCGKMIGDVMNQ